MFNNANSFKLHLIVSWSSIPTLQSKFKEASLKMSVNTLRQMVIASLQVQNTGVYSENNKNAVGQTLRGSVKTADASFFVFESL